MFNTVNLFGKRKEEEKDKQIKDLRTSFPSLRRPNNDDALFEMLFEVDKKYNTLRIYISPDFPSTKPVLQVVGTITHAWLDQYKRVVGCEKLNHWTKTSSLSEVFQSTLTTLQGGVNLSPNSNSTKEYPSNVSANIHSNPPSSQQNSNRYLQQNSNNLSSYPGSQYQQQQYPTLPPPVTSFPSSNSYMHQVTPNPNIDKSNSSPSYKQQPYSPPPAFDSSKSHEFFPYGTGSNKSDQSDKFRHMETPIEKPSVKGDDSSQRPNSTEIKIPAIPDSFPELKNLSENQLERLLGDEIALQALVRSMASVEGMQSLRDQLRDSNLDQAKQSLAKDEEINLLYNEVKELQQALKKETSDYQSKLSATTKKYGTSREDCLKLLKSKMNSLEKHSENLSETFVSGDSDMNTFLQDYLDTRSQFHTISMKLDAL